ncbi:hypothetical protein [Nannocystis punicea]|uniref:Uncharacterized protein n=1 Tax=Nannocystis punicea TaxID=2995304 RepID=A0ABY7GUY3_9BACT|nr:hypothetical protein [Nannocystis poenicansa]WAS90776.1 hypothetical protein O0S08_31700 [Nannocystis poenicansa]
MPNTTIIRLPSAACFTLLLAAAVPFAALGATPAEAVCGYVDASDYVQGDAQIDAWYSMLSELKQDFDDVCGDTFCEGDYSNIESLGYRCSVHQASGRIGQCVWMFAASSEEIDPETGEVLAEPHFWRCPTPLAPDTTIEELLAAVAGQSPLYAPLPGSDLSIYDGLVDCL